MSPAPLVCLKTAIACEAGIFDNRRIAGQFGLPRVLHLVFSGGTVTERCLAEMGLLCDLRKDKCRDQKEDTTVLALKMPALEKGKQTQ